MTPRFQQKTRKAGRGCQMIVCVVVAVLCSSSLAVLAQECSAITGDNVTLRIYTDGYKSVQGPPEQILQAMMRASTRAELDGIATPRRNCYGAAVTGRFYVENKYEVRAEKGLCDAFEKALRCHQALGWPLSLNPLAPKKKEVSGTDILLSELKEQKKKGPNDAALNRIDDEEDNLGCSQKGPDDPACHSLEIRRSNLINGKPEFQGVNTNAASGQAAVNAANPSAKKASSEPSKSGAKSSIDVDSGMAASQCVTSNGLEESFYMSGLKSECAKIINGSCHGKRVTATFQNSCKRSVSSNVEWGGKIGFVSVPRQSSAQSVCQVSSGTDPGFPKVNCSPGTLIDPHF